MVDFGLFLYQTHPFSYFFEVSSKKTKLPKRNAYNQYHHGPDEGNEQNINRKVEPGAFDAKQGHNPLTHKAGKATANCKSAKDKHQLQRRNLPFRS